MSSNNLPEEASDADEKDSASSVLIRHNDAAAAAGGRKFHDLEVHLSSASGLSKAGSSATGSEVSLVKLDEQKQAVTVESAGKESKSPVGHEVFAFIRDNLIGKDTVFNGPYGPRKG